MKELKNDFDSFLVDTRASRSLVKEESEADSSADVNEQDLHLFYEMVRNDPICSSAFDATVDVYSYNGYDFIPTASSYEKKALSTKLTFDNELYFEDILDNVAYNLLYYGEAFIEIVNPKEIYVLDTEKTGIKFTKAGVIKYYFQHDKENEKKWRPDEIVHITMKKVGHMIHSVRPLEPIAKEYSTNLLARDHLLKLFKNSPPKILYSLMNANKEQRATFIQNLQLAKKNPEIDLVAQGEVKVDILGLQIYKDLMTVLDYLRIQILSITRVPPLWLGILSEGSDRGNAEAQIFGFETRIRKLQRKVETKVNAELLPRLKVNGLLFKFNPFSLKDEKNILMNAELMVNIGIKRSRIAEYLSSRGITVKEEDI